MINFKEWFAEGGLWANIHAKRKRIKNGSGERMRKPGSKGAPTDADFKAANEEVQIDEIVVALAPIDVRNPKKPELTKVRYQGDIVPPTKPPSTEKRGVKGRPGQRPMPANEETIHVGHRNSKGDWIKTSTHSNYPDAKNAMAELEKQGKKGVQHRYDNAGSIDPGMRTLSHEELSADEQFDLIEETVEQLAKENNLDPEAIWEALDSVDDTELLEYAIDKKGHKSSTGGLTQKGVDAYNRESGGNLQMAVTTPPSKLKPDSKAAKRRKSFCARMGGVKGPMKDDKGRPTRKALALRKWNC